MEQKQPSSIAVGKDGFAYVDGVKIGRYIPERQTLEFIDPNRQRCQQKGRQVVEVKIAEFSKLNGDK